MKRLFSVLLCAMLLLALLPAVSPSASAESLSHFNIRIDKPVASYCPDFTPEFSTDVQIYTSVTWQENSPGFNAKLNSTDEFKAGLAYKAVIWVRFGDGHYLSTDSYGDLAAALTVNGEAISHLKIEGRNSQGNINEVTITCEYDPLPGRVINSVTITGIPTPVEGQMPIYSFTVDSAAYFYYHTAPVVWWDQTEGREMESSDTFIKGHIYQLNIWIQANREGGFSFKVDGSGNPQVDVVLNSWAADRVTKAYEQDGREVIDIRYNFPPCQAAHTCAPTLVPLQKQTCVLPGFKAYYECSCGKCYEDAAGKKEITDLDGYGIIPADGHTEGNWSYNNTQHYKTCTTCKEVIPGTSADHKWSPTYLYKDSKGHAWVCADCKAHSDLEAHKPGPEATETKPQICTQCDYVIAPAKNHTHELTLLPDVPPTCIASGTVAHYTCSGCTALFSDAEGKHPLPEDTNVVIPPLGHTLSDDWKYDEDTHWRSCTVCEEVMAETQMAHELKDGKCATCGYDSAAPTESSPEPTESQLPNDDNPGLPWWALPLIVLGSIAAGVGIAFLFLKAKKKA